MTSADSCALIGYHIAEGRTTMNRFRPGSVSTPPPGVAFARLAKAMMTGSVPDEWSDTPGVAAALRCRINETQLEMVTRGTVNPGTASDTTYASALVQYTNMASEFAALLRPMTIVGKMQVRMVPFEIRYPRQTGGATVGWIGSNVAIPVSALALESSTLGFAKAGAIVVITKELARFSSPAADVLFRDELLAAAAQFLDQQFISPSAVAVTDVQPASITNGIVATQSTGSTTIEITADLEALLTTVADADVSFTAPAWVMKNSDAARLACKRTTTGGVAFPDVRVNGGTLLGIPVITSNSVPSSVSGGSIVVLVDASQIDVADEGMLAVDSAEHATLQLDSAPSSSAASQVSLWQSGLVGFRLVAFRNWQRRRDAAVAVLDNVHW